MDSAKIVDINTTLISSIKSLTGNETGCEALLQWLVQEETEQAELLQRIALAALHNPDAKISAYQLEGSKKILATIIGRLTKIFNGSIK